MWRISILAVVGLVGVACQYENDLGDDDFINCLSNDDCPDNQRCKAALLLQPAPPPAQCSAAGWIGLQSGDTYLESPEDEMSVFFLCNAQARYLPICFGSGQYRCGDLLCEQNQYCALYPDQIDPFCVNPPVGDTPPDGWRDCKTDSDCNGTGHCKQLLISADGDRHPTEKFCVGIADSVIMSK